MNRRQMIVGGSTAVGLFALTGYGPCSPATKAKAVKYTELALGYLKDVSPILTTLGASEIVGQIGQAIPLLEKLKTALENTDIPTAASVFEQIQNVLSAIATALLNLPESPRRTTILGILALVNMTLRTVSAFVEAETPPSAAAIGPGPKNALQRAASAKAIKAAFEATRF